MTLKVTLGTLALCTVIAIVTTDKLCDGCRNKLTEYTRIKRAKYYSNPPTRFYRRPPPAYPVKGYFSYTPPPGYMIDNEDRQPPRPKVSRRPTNDGLGDEDINNIVKYLSKQDLDKIIEFASEKERVKYKNEAYELDDKPFNNDDIKYEYKGKDVQAEQKFSLNGPYANGYNDNTNNERDTKPTYVKDYTNYKPIQDIDTDKTLSLVGPLVNGYSGNSNRNINNLVDTTQSKVVYITHQDNRQVNSNLPLETEESMRNNQFAFLNTYINKEVKTEDLSDFTDSKIMDEEQLPKPLNLRDDHDFEISFTNNIPTVVKADSDSYKVESFGNLPLMNYNSKLDTVSSYHVPHYTVTSSTQQSSLPSSSLSASTTFSVESPPPPSAAKHQSDAHLRAVKIWSHRSKGTAYTLHDDGTLSLEKPRSKFRGHV